MIDFTVIIPVEKKSRNLFRCLASVKKLKGVTFEVKVVDNKFSGCPSAKRNHAAKHAKGRFLAFLDDDCEVRKDWLLKAGLIMKERKDLSAVCGPMLTPRESSFLENVSGALLASPIVVGGEGYRNMMSKDRIVYDYPTANFIIRKKDFNDLGGFDERFWPGEDTKLCLDIVNKLNKRIFYSRDVVVYHRRRTLFKPFLEQVARYARQRGRFARLFPGTSRKLLYFIPSIFFVYLLLISILALLGRGSVWMLPVVIMYFVFVIEEAARVFVRTGNFMFVQSFIVGAVLTNLVYGFNFLGGLLKR